MHIACHGFSKEQQKLLYEELEINLEGNQNNEFKRIKKPVCLKKSFSKCSKFISFFSIRIMRGSMKVAETI